VRSVAGPPQYVARSAGTPPDDERRECRRGERYWHRSQWGLGLGVRGRMGSARFTINHVGLRSLPFWSKIRLYSRNTRGGAGLLQCPRCSTEVLEGSKFCRKCGTALRRACLNCGHAILSEDSFCSECGASVATGSITPAPSSTLRTASTSATSYAAERRQLTIMFCDMVGSSALSTRSR
jgi:hypothetical protein